MQSGNSFKKNSVFFVVVVAVLFVSASAGTIYVDASASGSNNGSSWADAYNYLQDALAVAGDGNDIWVADGTYKPDENTANPGGTGSRTATFQLINGVALYGGFAGGETSLDERDWQTNVTILSGDLDGNDVGFTNNGENSYHVVTGSNTDANAVLDGFTITAGNANGSNPDDRGGGMYSNSGSPTVTNCTFNGNVGRWGGGMNNELFSSPTVSNCTFSGNSGGWGGGMFNYQSSPTVSNCTFSDNTGNEAGGGMDNWSSNPTLANCTFSGNSAKWGGGMDNSHNSSPLVTNCVFIGNSGGGSGGGMYNYVSNPTLTNCTFSGNSAGWSGGGMFNDGSSPTVTNCTFSGNSAGDDGGGMYNTDNTASSPTVTNCTFSGNSAGDDGGGMFNDFSSPTVTNCTFSGNSAGWSGGGMFNDFFSSPTLSNCTFSGNSADYEGGGMYNDAGSPTVSNCILWGNTAASDGNEIALLFSSTIDVNYCDIKGGNDEIYNSGSTINWGPGNIDVDPCFVDPGQWTDPCNTPGDATDDVWVDGDYHLLTGSPCIDTGDNNSVPADTIDLDGDGNTVEPIPWDLDGLPRFVDGDANGTDIVDMGAYEFRLAIGAIVDIRPETLNLKSKRVITAFIELAEPYSVEDIDLDSVQCQGAGAIRGTIANDTLIVKFERQDLQDIEPGQEVELLVTGELTDGTVFEGTDVIRVIDKGNEK